MQANDVLWDVGANVGVVAMYAAIRNQRCRIVAFEPSPVNFWFLVQNLRFNDLLGKVTPLPIALSDGDPTVVEFNLRSWRPGDWGNEIHPSSSGLPQQWGTEATVSALSISVDDIVRIFRVPAPDHIKLDVDGLEPQILRGAKSALIRVKSVLVEWIPETLGRYDEGEKALLTPLSEAGLVEDGSFRGRGSGRNRLFVRPSG